MRPTVRSRRLGRKLGYYRQEMKLSGTELATKLEIHQATWSKIESGKTKISPKVLANAGNVLEIPAPVRTQLERLRRKAEEPGWWQDYGDILSEAVQMLIELEADAEWIRSYAGEVIPGLLQTGEYAERLITAGSPHIRVADIDRYLELRVRRQRRLNEGMRLTAILSEAAIRQQVGGPLVLRTQLQHVINMVRERDVTVQVVPFTADAHAALCESFTIIQWPDEADPEAVYVDGLSSWVVHERAGLIRTYLYAFASVQGAALPPRESLELIDSVMKDL